VPLSPRQLGVIARGAARELTWGLPAVSREVRRWRTLAGRIPDAELRQDALSALEGKRGQTDGAALFVVLPRVRNSSLLRLLVAYQIIWDYLDSAHERAPDRANGRQLHLALVDALDLGRPITDYYRYHPWHDDGGYLNALVEVCRESCAALRSYERVRPLVVREAMRGQVLAINHDLDPRRRDTALQAWARAKSPAGHEASWFELTGAASAGLTIFALLAAGSEPECNDSEIARTQRTYFPWISTVATMLDSYVDQVEDAASGDHIYIAHYDTPQLAQQRIRRLIQHSLAEARALPNGERHALIVACMIAMYLSKDSARTEAMRATTASFVTAGGPLTKTLLPILRLWRIVHALRAA
jgi:tetraprenyl-beta-curcumene synthase